MLRQNQTCIHPSSNVRTTFPDGDLHLEPDGGNLRHPLQHPARSWTHLAQAAPSSQQPCHSGPFGFGPYLPFIRAGDVAQAELHLTCGEMQHATASQVMEPPVFIWRGAKAMRKWSTCEHSLEIQSNSKPINTSHRRHVLSFWTELEPDVSVD